MIGRTNAVSGGDGGLETATVTCKMDAPGEFYVAYFNGTQTIYETVVMGEIKELQVVKESFIVSRGAMGVSGNLEKLQGTQLYGSIYIVHGNGTMQG